MLHYKVDYDGPEVVAACVEIPDILGWGDTEEEAVRMLVSDLIEYGIEYTEHPDFYKQDRTRVAHEDYIMEIMAAWEEDAVRDILTKVEDRF